MREIKEKQSSSYFPAGFVFPRMKDWPAGCVSSLFDMGHWRVSLRHIFGAEWHFGPHAAKLEQYFFSNSITKEFNIHGNFVDAHNIDLGFNDGIVWSGQEFAMIPS